MDSDLYFDTVALNVPINMCNLCVYFFTVYINLVVTFSALVYYSAIAGYSQWLCI
jgi:hypothetical protein